MLTSEPGDLARGGAALERGALDARDASLVLRDAHAAAASGLPDGLLPQSLEQFAAAWAGGLTACALAAEHLAGTAQENGRQLREAGGA